MTDMAERVKKWANRNLWCIVGKDMQKEIIDSRNIILALVEVAGKVEKISGVEWLFNFNKSGEGGYHQCPICYGIRKPEGKGHNPECKLESFKKSLITCEARIAEVLGGDHHCWADPDNVDHCGHCGKRFGEKEPCGTCMGSGEVVKKFHTDSTAMNTYMENMDCPDCIVRKDKSTYYHSDPSTKGVEKREQRED